MSRTLSEQAAAAVIANVLDQDLVDPYFDAGRIMSALHDAGFAVVKKPEPDRSENGRTVYGFGVESFDSFVSFDDYTMTPDDARHVAAEILAAADYAEMER